MRYHNVSNLKRYQNRRVDSKNRSQHPAQFLTNYRECFESANKMQLLKLPPSKFEKRCYDISGYLTQKIALLKPIFIKKN